MEKTAKKESRKRAETTDSEGKMEAKLKTKVGLPAKKTEPVKSSKGDSGEGDAALVENGTGKAKGDAPKEVAATKAKKAAPKTGEKEAKSTATKKEGKVPSEKKEGRKPKAEKKEDEESNGVPEPEVAGREVQFNGMEDETGKSETDVVEDSGTQKSSATESKKKPAERVAKGSKKESDTKPVSKKGQPSKLAVNGDTKKADAKIGNKDSATAPMEEEEEKKGKQNAQKRKSDSSTSSAGDSETKSSEGADGPKEAKIRVVASSDGTGSEDDGSEVSGDAKQPKPKKDSGKTQAGKDAKKAEKEAVKANKETAAAETKGKGRLKGAGSASKTDSKKPTTAEANESDTARKYSLRSKGKSGTVRYGP